jgi:hypothetical protein
MDAAALRLERKHAAPSRGSVPSLADSPFPRDFYAYLTDWGSLKWQKQPKLEECLQQAKVRQSKSWAKMDFSENEDLEP